MRKFEFCLVTVANKMAQRLPPPSTGHVQGGQTAAGPAGWSLLPNNLTRSTSCFFLEIFLPGHCGSRPLQSPTSPSQIDKTPRGFCPPTRRGRGGQRGHRRALVMDHLLSPFLGPPMHFSNISLTPLGGGLDGLDRPPLAGCALCWVLSAGS